jgi:hypothetical protein
MRANRKIQAGVNAGLRPRVPTKCLCTRPMAHVMTKGPLIDSRFPPGKVKPLLTVASVLIALA